MVGLVVGKIMIGLSVTRVDIETAYILDAAYLGDRHLTHDMVRGGLDRWDLFIRC